MHIENPFISVIIVVYNGAHTIRKALESVIRQTYRNIEIICVDGASTDNTLQILKSFESSINQLITEPDNGIYDAMNKGIKHSKGDYLYFLGADDYLPEDGIFHHVAELIRESGADLLYGNVKFSNSGNIYGGEFIYEKLLIKNLPHQAAFYHRRLFKQIGGYNLSYPYHADWDFNLSCFSLKDINIRYFNQTVAVFQEGNTSSSADKTLLKQRLIPAILSYQESQPRFLKNIRNFDFLWRFVRNAAIHSIDQIAILKTSPYLEKIIQKQNKFSSKLLRQGWISKSMMVSCFISCRLKKLI